MPVPAVVVNLAEEVMVTMLGTTRATSSCGVSEIAGGGGVVVMTVTGDCASGCSELGACSELGVSGGAARVRPPSPSTSRAAIHRPRLMPPLPLLSLIRGPMLSVYPCRWCTHVVGVLMPLVYSCQSVYPVPLAEYPVPNNAVPSLVQITDSALARSQNEAPIYQAQQSSRP